MNTNNLKKHTIADVIVLGAGGSGLAAAVSAYESGVKKITVVEAQKTPGGNSMFPTGIFGADTKLQRRLGAKADKDVVFRAAMEYAHWKLNGKLVRTLINRSSATIDWLETKGVVFDEIIPLFNNFHTNTYHTIKSSRKIGALIVKNLMENCTKVGIPVFVKTHAKKILVDTEGAVKGVSVISEGEKIDIQSKAVIVATGGFLGNSKLMSKFDPLYNEDEVIYRGLKHNGDGFLMALEAGASTDGQLTTEMESPTFRESPFLNVICKQPNTIWVNKTGERFIDEDVNTNEEASNAIYRQPGKICYSVFDDTTLNQILNEEISPAAQRATGGKSFKSGVIGAVSKFSKENRIKVSKSLNDIADWMGSDPDCFSNTINNYNKCCEQGYDEEFVKNRIYLRKIESPPFYAIPCSVSLLVAHCGIRVNHKTEALCKDYKPLPGLYAVGADMAGTVANTYNIRIGGNSFGFAIGSGRLAGEQVAQYLG